MKTLFVACFLTALAAPSNRGFEPKSNWQKKFAEYITANPKVSLSTAVTRANNILENEGLATHVLFKSTSTWNVAKDLGWTYLPPKGQNPCDQRVGTISSVQGHTNFLKLAHKNRDLKVALPPNARLAKVEVTLRDSKDPVVAFHSPVLSPPMGVSEDGTQIYFRYLLDAPTTAIKSWFRNAIRDSEELLEEAPFLVLAVDRTGQFRFLDLLEAYEEQDAEADDFDEDNYKPNETSTSTRAFEFKPYGWILRFEEACENEGPLVD